MGYSFMSIGKIKSFSEMSKAYSHNYRITDVPNADKSKEYLNEELVRMEGTYEEAFKRRLEEAGIESYRKNAVKLLDVVTTFSREDIGRVDLDRWKDDQVRWLRDTFDKAADNRSNVLSVMFHGDEEGNVHCHSMIVPIDSRGHLCAREYTGTKKHFYDMQKSYGNMMEERHGLSRGIRGSVARHKDIKQFYSDLNAAKEVDLPTPYSHESIQDYESRVKSAWETYKNQELGRRMELEKEFTEKMSVMNSRNIGLSEEIKAMSDELQQYKELGDKDDIETELGEYRDLKSGLEKLDESEREKCEKLIENISKMGIENSFDIERN